MNFFTRLQGQPEVGSIIALYVVLAVIYSLITPILEASDEISHYPVVQHIAATGQLPVQRPGVETLWEQEGSQPPLYYLISAGLTAWIDTSDLPEIRWRNPHAKLGVPLDPDNKNMIIHTEAEQWPWRGTVLAIHLVRLFSVALGTGSICLAFLLAQEAWPASRVAQAFSVALMAFNPMFLFISGSVNNDNLTILFGTWLLLLCVRIVKHGLPLQRGLTLAVVTALITLTKLSGLTFLPLIGLSLAFHAWQRQAWRQSLYAAVGLTGAWLTLAGWWYLRNLRLYGELLGTDTHVAIVGGRQIGVVEAVTQEWYSFWVAFWGWFGAVNILLPQPIYWFMAVMQAAALIGLAYWVLQMLRSKVYQALIVPALLGMQALIMTAAVVRWTLITMGSQGRLIFPALAGISALTAWGLLWAWPERQRGYLAGVLSLALAGVAAWAPFGLIRPAYMPPPVVERPPESATPIEAHFGALELLALSTEQAVITPGGWVPVTVYWRLNQAVQEDYSVYFSLLGRSNTEIGKLDTYPGAGSLPTSRMVPGQIIEDRYLIQVDESFTTPTAVRILIGAGLYEPDEGYTLIFDPVDGRGEQIGSVIISAASAYPADASACAQQTDHTNQATFADLTTLHFDPVDAGPYTPGEEVIVSLFWQHFGTTPDDWTIFLHLVGSDGIISAQSDGPPLNGDYPTSAWRQPCTFTETRVITLPADAAPGTYRLLTGLYDPGRPDLPRMPIAGTVPADIALPGENAVELGRIEVVQP